MIGSQAVPLDWRTLRAELERHLEGAGGVVHVKAGPCSSTQVFADVLHEVWLPESAPEWTVLRVDPADDTLHYPSDLLREIARLIEYTLPGCKATTAPISIAGRARSRRDLIVRDIHVYPDGNTQVERADVEGLCGELERFLSGRGSAKVRRLALIFSDAHQIKTKNRRRIAQTLWNDRLGALVEHGLLLVTIYDAGELSDDTCGFPPPAPNTIVTLPTYFATPDDRAHAIKDLAAHSMRAGWHPNETAAGIYAEGLVNSSESMKDLQARIATYWSRRR